VNHKYGNQATNFSSLLEGRITNLVFGIKRLRGALSGYRSGAGFEAHWLGCAYRLFCLRRRLGKMTRPFQGREMAEKAVADFGVSIALSVSVMGIASPPQK
jgi:hypothetical protein